ncbi:hypothetical protein KP509_27G000700 [Ceratopteris richardii]|uniref:BHLH domain-containing protein n=1 Tax=Ceratopteris richardii TaxID=49495 RepID=A0A8T2REQ7_CERRI|nr:hypothetical protein KP509_27G000700 [Ceratopteris richardii]
MGQLRDWWPSEDALLKRSSAVPPNAGLAQPSHPLHLLEAAAALNEDAGNGMHGKQSLPFASSPASQMCTRAPIKLLNSEDHKQELLRNLLNSKSANPSQQGQGFSPGLSPQDAPLVNPRSPGSFSNLLQQQVHSKPTSSSSHQEDVALSLHRQGISSPSAFTSPIYHSVDDSLRLERTAVNNVQEKQQRIVNRKESLVPEKVIQQPLTRKEAAVTPGSEQNMNGYQRTNILENSGSSHSAEKNSGKVRSLHEVQDHPINKELLSRREIHIFSERQRRKGMTHLYTTLLSLLPDAKPKTDRCKVLTDAMEYIQTLRDQVEALGSQKAELMASLGENEGDPHSTDYMSGPDGDAANSSTITGVSEEVKEEILSSADVAVRFCGREAFITLNSCKTKGVWSGILQILHEQEMEIFNVTLSSGNEMDHHCIHAKIPKTCNVRSQEVQKLLQDLIVSHATVD